MRALTGRVDPMPYAIIRIAVALTVLVRTTDWLSPLVDLDHHAWVHGIENAPWDDPVLEPRLRAPLVPGLDVLGTAPLAAVAVVLRTLLAAWLLTGIRPRTTAAVLATIGWAIMASSSFRYLHHLHLLWVVCALSALGPSGERLALWRRPGAEWAPRWPLQMLRLQSLVIYAASGLAKLRVDWLDGSSVEQLGRTGAIDRGLVALVGPVPLAIGTAVTELGLVGLLGWRRTRSVGVGIALAFHALTAATMTVSTFPWTMATLLVAFLPWREERESEPAQRQS